MAMQAKCMVHICVIIRRVDSVYSYFSAKESVTCMHFGWKTIKDRLNYRHIILVTLCEGNMDGWGNQCPVHIA
jgi:hypothetical protein